MKNYNFKTQQLEIKSVCDRSIENKQNKSDFIIIYFLEAIKCGRYKYAYSKLSYELKSEIKIDVLDKYFKDFDAFAYIDSEDVYITQKNNKVTGIYHFVVKDNMIDNIY